MLATVAQVANCFLFEEDLPRAAGHDSLEKDSRLRRSATSVSPGRFVAFTTGALRDGEVWRYRIMAPGS
jgi:hypothetical protein